MFKGLPHRKLKVRVQNLRTKATVYSVYFGAFASDAFRFITHGATIKLRTTERCTTFPEGGVMKYLLTLVLDQMPYAASLPMALYGVLRYI